MSTPDERAPEARCGAVTTFGGAFPPMACTLPRGHRGPHDADRAVPVREVGEGLVEQIAYECWVGMSYPQDRDHPDTRRVWQGMPRWDTRVGIAYATADRILALLASAPDAPGGEREPAGWQREMQREMAEIPAASSASAISWMDPMPDGGERHLGLAERVRRLAALRPAAPSEEP